MTPLQTEEFIARLLADHPDLCLDSRSIGRWSPLLAKLTSEQRHSLFPLARQHEARYIKARYAGSELYANYTEDDWQRIAGSYMPEELVTDPPWPTAFDHMRSDILDITDPRNWPPHLVVPERNEWVFVAEYLEVSAPISGPARFWVAAKQRSESDPFLTEHGRAAGLEMRYFLRYESGLPRILLMWRQNTLARYFSHLADSGLEDLGRAVIGRPEFRYIEGSLRHRISGQRESRRQVFVGPSTVPRSLGS